MPNAYTFVYSSILMQIYMGSQLIKHKLYGYYGIRAREVSLLSQIFKLIRPIHYTRDTSAIAKTGQYCGSEQTSPGQS